MQYQTREIEAGIERTETYDIPAHVTLGHTAPRRDDFKDLEGIDRQDEIRGEANANRIVACVNACAGIENPDDLRRQRDELLEALNGLVWYMRAMNQNNKPIKIEHHYVAALDAIAKAEGKNGKN